MSLLRSDAFLSPLEIEDAVTRTLKEDLGRAGDITSIATVPEDAPGRAMVVARKAGVVSGLPLVAEAFRRLSPEIKIETHAVRDGAAIKAGTKLMTIAGMRQPPARSAPHSTLHGDLSGIATATAHLQWIAPHRRRAYSAPKDHAGVAGAGETRGAFRGRLQSPLRPR